MTVSISRRIAAGLLGAALASFALGGEAHASGEEAFHVVTTFTVIQDIAQNVAGDRAIVESITKPGAEIHDYQPTPLDIVRRRPPTSCCGTASISNAGSSASSRTSRRCRASSSPTASSRWGSPKGPYTGKPNPHAWMSPSNALIYVENIRKALVANTTPTLQTLQQERRRLCGADQGAGRALAQATRRDPGGRSAAWCRAKARSATSRATTA